MVDDLIVGIKAGLASKALENAVSDCGALLEEHDVELRPDDEDELPDEPRIRDR